MIPQTIGHLARFGDGRALETLMRWTAADDARELLWSAARRHPDPQRTVADLLSMALRGLAFTGDPSARERLRSVMAEELRYTEDRGGLARDALQSLELCAEL
jgi:hypothetical protein